MSSSAQPSHLSIGEVLSLVQQEFPDVSISKIRFLESQGLIAPERTASGFRKFYNSDIQRLRWILRQQSEHFLPLKVIRKMLDDGTDFSPEASGVGSQPTLWSGPEGTSDEPASGRKSKADPGSKASSGAADSADSEKGDTGAESSGAESSSAKSSGASAPGVKKPNPHRSAAHPSVVSAAAMSRAASPGRGDNMETSDDSPATEATPAEASPPGNRPGKPARTPGDAPKREPKAEPAQAVKHRTISTPADIVAALQEDPRPRTARRNPPPLPVAGQLVRQFFSAEEISAPASENEFLSADEVCDLFSIDTAMLNELESFGLLSPRKFGGVSSYDAPDVEIIGMAVKYASIGVEARHLRMYKIAAEREAGFIEQLVVPLLKQRNPASRENASERSSELASMGNELHNLILKRHLRRLLGHR